RHPCAAWRAVGSRGADERPPDERESTRGGFVVGADPDRQGPDARSMVDVLAGPVPDVSRRADESQGDGEMTRSGIVAMLSAVVAGTAALNLDARRAQELQVFRSTANAVSVDVTVQDSGRRPITRLTAADFEVLDNGVKQEIGEIGYARLPIDVTVALDVSYSVNGLMLERLRRGVVQLMSDFGAEDRLRLLLFNSKVARTLDFTSNASSVEA